MAQQQEEVGGKIIAAEQLLLEESIVLSGQGARETLRSAGDVVVAEEMRQVGKLSSPGQFLENAAQRQQVTDVDFRGQGRRLRAEMDKPAEDVRITAQLR
jgi:hypothetical protein